MDFRFSKEEQAFRQEVRQFLREELPPDWVGLAILTDWVSSDENWERHKLMARLEQQWQGVTAASRIKEVTLHYLEGHIQVELKLPLALLEEDPQVSRDDLQAEFDKVAARLDEVSAVKLSFV